EGVLSLGGEVADIRSKKRALRRAAAFPEVRWVVDHLHVQPAIPMEDGEIAVHVANALLGERAFDDCDIEIVRIEALKRERALEAPRGALQISVEDGVVTFDGDVPSTNHRRLAGVIAWWIPGTRDVRNFLGVLPPEVDNDDELSDAVRVVLEKEPFVDAAQLSVQTKGGIVTLRGCVLTKLQREIAERDAWWVLGVEDVVDEIDVVH
ncbi:MAG TPA: BON domain-containing protein, partial [Polyangiaceae bacterium]